MYEQIALQETLIKCLQERRNKNQSYSLRSFARHIGISSSALSEILNGKRKVSNKLGLKIIAKLNLSKKENDRLICLYSNKTNSKKTVSLSRESIEQQKNMLQVLADDFNTISKWYYFGVLSLAETKDFVGEASWIAMRLNISKKQASEALKRLLEIGALKKNEDSTYTFNSVNLKTPDEMKSLALQSAHLNQMELAKHSLLNDPISERDFTSVTMAINPAKLEQAKLLLRDFRKRLSMLLEEGEQSEVYIYSSYLYPVSRRKK